MSTGNSLPGTAQKWLLQYGIVVNIDQNAGLAIRHDAIMTGKAKKALEVRCPTCGAKPGEKCELSTGQPRTEPHRDRRVTALDK